MPIESCTLPGGKSGFRWGKHGKCYPTRGGAEAQARAAYAHGYGKVDLGVLLGGVRAMQTTDLGVLLKGIDDSAHAAATSPTNDLSEPSSVKIKAGNYKKGHIKISGVNISIENPAGSYRRPEWPVMQAHYGYIRGTEGADGDAVDVFVRPATEEDWAGEVHVIHQLNAVGAHDEDKVMMGYDTKATAVSAYLAHYPKDWVLGPVTTYSFKQFKQWLKENAK